MVEFALVAPLFFLLLFGIIEAGRFIFYYETLQQRDARGRAVRDRQRRQLDLRLSDRPTGPGRARHCDPPGDDVVARVRESRRHSVASRGTRWWYTVRLATAGSAGTTAAAPRSPSRPRTPTRPSCRSSPCPPSPSVRSRALSSTTSSFGSGPRARPGPRPLRWWARRRCSLVAALAFDVGMMLVERRDQQNAADAAALAGPGTSSSWIAVDAEDAARQHRAATERLRRCRPERGRQRLHPRRSTADTPGFPGSSRSRSRRSGRRSSAASSVGRTGRSARSRSRPTTRT